MYALAPFGAKHEIIRPRVEERLSWAFAQPLGGVVTAVREALPPDMRARVEQANEARKYLAHEFWWDRCAGMKDEAGREDLRRSLNEEVARFRALSDALDLVVAEKMKALGFGEDEWQRLVAEALVDPDPSPIPPQPVPHEREEIIRAWWWPRKPGTDNLVLEGRDGACWQLGDCGLSWSTMEEPAADWRPCAMLAKYLPALVVSRPKGAPPWDYRLHFSTGVFLAVRLSSDGPTFQLKMKVERQQRR